MNLSCKVNGCARAEITAAGVRQNGLFTFRIRFRIFAMLGTRQRDQKGNEKRWDDGSEGGVG